jgi:uncharacterized protein (TIGR02611 family)
VKAVLLFIARSAKRVAVTVVGAALLVGGLIMMVTPGPGLLLIVLGLAVLATEYVWARRALDMAKRKAGEAARRVRRRGRGPKTPSA